MRIKAALGVLGALALMATPLAAAAETPAVGAGLWPSGYEAGTVDCGSFVSDDRGFCQVYDTGSVELGVKFTSSQSVLATGVRVYRVDGGTVSGSLWKAGGGSALASGTFPAAPSSPDWQDLAFTTPVPLVPGTTYIASYFAPNADYAAENYYFANKEVTVGPITALQSVEANLNGVYCYDATTCFPSDSFRDSNYWVTPLWAYGFDGFHQPIDVGIWNTAQAGRAIPVKFGLSGDQGLAIFQSGFPRATPIACDLSAAADAVEETTSATTSSLTYEPTSDQYVYTWKTARDWANKCYRFELGLVDGTSHSVDVRFTK
jgi:hypothetical protein